MLGFVEELREQLQVIQRLQLGNVWVNFVHQANLGSSAPTARRRRALILALPGDPGHWTLISEITRLTPDVAVLYSGKTRKTLTRDINGLAEAGLLTRAGDAVRPNHEQMFAFLPLRKLSESELVDSLARVSVPNPEPVAAATV